MQVERLDLKRVTIELRRGLEQAHAARLDVRVKDVPRLAVPWPDLVQTLGALLKNALDASAPIGTRVVLTIEEEDDHLRFSVVDSGTGWIDVGGLDGAEAFFDAEESSDERRLGLVRARQFAERLGGRLTFQSAQGRGTRAVLTVPSAYL